MVKDASGKGGGAGMNWRERNMAAREKRPGESQTEADTRRAGQKVQRGMFVPHAVRVAELKRNGYNATDADRVADFQSSSMGQDMLAGTNMSAVASDYTGELAQQKFREQFGRAPEALRHGGNGKGAGQPGTNVGAAFEQPSQGAGSAGAQGGGASSAMPSGTPAQSGDGETSAGTQPVFEGEANAFGLKGKTREERMAHAKTLPRPDGKEGTYYDQLAQERRTQNALADMARQQKEKEPKKPEFNSEASGSVQMPDGSMREIKSGDSEQGTATFTMPDGTVRKIGANESPSWVIDLAKKEAGIEAKSPPPNPEEMKRQQEIDRIVANSAHGGKKGKPTSDKAPDFKQPAKPDSDNTAQKATATPVTPPKPKEVAFAQPGKSDTGGKVSSARAKLESKPAALQEHVAAAKKKADSPTVEAKEDKMYQSLPTNLGAMNTYLKQFGLTFNHKNNLVQFHEKPKQLSREDWRNFRRNFQQVVEQRQQQSSRKLASRFQ